MRIKSDDEFVECTLIDPTGPIAWLDGEILMGRSREDTDRFIEVRVVKGAQASRLVPRDCARDRTEYLVRKVLSPSAANMADEIVSPDGRRVLMRIRDDGSTYTRLLIYDIAK